MWLGTGILIAFLLGSAGIFGLQSPSDVSIIVIGSGPSGIAASTRLLKNNFTNIKIIEAENRIGGRINSVKFGDAYVDLGAEFCHGETGNIVYSIAQPYNVLEHTLSAYQFIRSNGQRVDNELGIKIMEFAESLGATDETIGGCERVKSVGECLEIKAKEIQNSTHDHEEAEILTEALVYVDKYLCSYDSPFDLNDLKITTEYKHCGGDNHMTWKGRGYKTILEIMMEKYPDETGLPIDDKIILNKTVKNITNWDGDKVTVTTDDGSTYSVDHVIFTPSLGVLKADHERLFSPSLAKDKVEAIKERGFGAIVKVVLHFPTAWWSSSYYGLLWTQEDRQLLKKENMEWLLSTNGFARSAHNPNVLVSWFAGKYVPHIETLSEDEILKAHKLVIEKFLSPIYNVTMPDKLLRTQWYTNPHFRGTYSYESAKSTGENLQGKLAAPLAGKDGRPSVLFAGEATHPHYFSTVHGAIETGYREADRLIKLYKE